MYHYPFQGLGRCKSLPAYLRPFQLQGTDICTNSVLKHQAYFNTNILLQAFMYVASTG